MHSDVAALAPTLVLVTLGVALAACWVVALVDVLKRADWDFPARQFGGNDRMVWAFVVIVFGGLGALAYYFMVMMPYPRQRP